MPREVFYSIVIAHGLFFGMSFGVRNAIFMGMTNPAIAATQFTAFMGMSNLAISFANYWQGAVAERIDYATVFYLDALIADGYPYYPLPAGPQDLKNSGPE